MESCDAMTLTWGDVCENGPGMQKMGQIGEKGYTVDQLETFAREFEGYECKVYDLNELVEGDHPPAKVLVVREGMKRLLGGCTLDDVYREQLQLDVDKKAFMWGKVKNKRARWNLCFGEHSQEPNYGEKKGRVYSYSSLPCLDRIRKSVHALFKEENLVCEGNYYYDVKTCGIGAHGDSERRKVIGMRLGKTMPLRFGWFHNGVHVGKHTDILLRHGDLYVMSEKAVGFDWKKKKTYTVRHAAGAEKYLKFKT